MAASHDSQMVNAKSGRTLINRLAEPALTALSEALHPGRPTARVAEAITRAETRVEILVGWVQLVGVGLFIALYAITRSAFSSGGSFEPVPLALGAWGIFIALRLRRAYRSAPTRRFMILASAIEIFVLMVAIWSFTIQYHAPPALYLKAPTLFYVFIFLSIGALRFDPVQLAVTGLFASAGWLILVFIAANSAPVTSDYRVYLTSLSLLWGAEWEKIISILAVTGILALAVARCRALLVSTNSETIAAADLAKFLDRGAAERVRSSDMALRPGDGELKTACIMFLDLRGFSAAASRLSPSEVIDLLRQYQSRFVPVIEAAGGAVDKFMGDGMLVSFGTSRATSHPAAEALASIPSLLAAEDAWIAERKEAGLPALSVAIAITLGPVVHGVIGHGERLEFTVIGDAVNLAAKLEKHAKIESARVIATRDCLDLAIAGGVTAKPLRIVDSAKIEGVADAVNLVVLA